MRRILITVRTGIASRPRTSPSPFCCSRYEEGREEERPRDVDADSKLHFVENPFRGGKSPFLLRTSPSRGEPKSDSDCEQHLYAAHRLSRAFHHFSVWTLTVWRGPDRDSSSSFQRGDDFLKNSSCSLQQHKHVTTSTSSSSFSSRVQLNWSKFSQLLVSRLWWCRPHFATNSSYDKHYPANSIKVFFNEVLRVSYYLLL